MSDSTSSPSANQTAGLAHVLGIVTSFIAPLIIRLTNSKKDAFVAAHATEALNFQITAFAALTVNNILGVVLFFIWPLFGWAISLTIWAVNIYWSILGFQAANAGKPYRYPFAFRIVR